MMNRYSLAMVGFAVALVVGCGKSGPPVEPDAPTVDAGMAELSGMVEQAQASGDWSEALVRLEQAMGQESLDEHKGEVFSHLLMGYIQSGDTNKAVAVHLEHRADETLCQAGCAVIGRALGSREDPAAMLAWCEALTDGAGVAWVRERAWGTLMAAAAKRGELEVLLKKDLSRMLADEPAVQQRVVGRATRHLLQSEAFDAVESLLADVEAAGGEREWLPGFAAQVRLDLLLARSQWAAARDYVLTRGDVLSDSVLSGRLKRLMAATDAESEAVLDAFVGAMGGSYAARPVILNNLAHHWLAQAVEANAVELYLSRLRLVMAMDGVSPADLERLVKAGFYPLMSTAGPEPRKQMQALVAQIAAAQGDALTMEMALLQLDAAFYLEDWRGVLDVLEAGIPGREPEWHAQIKSKAEAHLALAEKRYEDAIVAFRAFMASVQSGQEQQSNPETGAAYLQERVLGVNAKRIGDIHGTLGQVEKQKSAYAEARTYYETALAGMEEGSDPYAEVKAELDQVP